MHAYIHTYVHACIHTREGDWGERGLGGWGGWEQREGERTTEHTRETRKRGRRRKGRGQCRRTEPEALKFKVNQMVQIGDRRYQTGFLEFLFLSHPSFPFTVWHLSCSKRNCSVRSGQGQNPTPVRASPHLPWTLE